RLYSISRFVDGSRNIFPLDNITVPMEWGVATSFNDASNLLCTRATSHPVTGWITGEVTTGYWYNPEGYPATRVALSIQPLSTRATAACKNLLKNAGMPWGQIKATHWMNNRPQGQSNALPTVLPFTQFYDATTVLRDKGEMQTLNVADLKPHDLVLLEVKIGRYNAEQAERGTYRRRTMNRWHAYLDMQAVYLLHHAPGSF
ncbi:hypothetical protein K438DRAFT_1589407, partial [Mycena galopus ATCC 62051]